MIIKTMLKALLGRRRWLKLKGKYDIEANGLYVIMMPDSDNEFNEYALRNIDNFLEYRKGRGVVILTTDKWVADNANRFSKEVRAVEIITQSDCNYLHQYYYYTNNGFSDRYVLSSLQDDNGIRLSLANNINGVTKEDLTCMGIYIIRSWENSGEPLHG